MAGSLPIAALASARRPDAGGFAEDVVVAHTALLVSTFQERYRSQLDDLSPGLGAFIHELDFNLDFDAAWDPAVGGLHFVLTEGPRTLPSRAVAFALRLHECGRVGAWEAPLEDDCCHHFDRWPLPGGDRIEVDAQGDVVQLRISNRGGQVEGIRFQRSGGRWTADGALPPLAEALDGRLAVRVWTRRELWSDEVQDLAVPVDDSEPDLMAGRCEEALALLRSASPTYHMWVERLLRFVAPWRIVGDTLPPGSSSTNLAHGLVGVGNQGHLLALADSLIHEVSHHYFYVALRLGPVHDGSDDRRYYNPFLELYRPVDRILLAYHAFANVLAFCREAALRTPSPFFEMRTPQLVHGLRILEDGLESSSALNAHGLALFEELRGLTHE